jgi:phosphomannomutase
MPPSDLFGTAGVRGPPDAVTPDLALAVGRAAARAADGETFAVSRDARVTGSGLLDALAAGLQSGGADAVVLGELPTPALAYASRGRRGAQITASHNPPRDNGVKLFVDGVEYDADAEARVAARVEDETTAAWDAWGRRREGTALADYRAAVAAFARGRGGPLSGDGDGDEGRNQDPDQHQHQDQDRTEDDGDALRVLADCGNGMAARAAPQVLSALGADVTALHADVDGRFPGRPSKPTAETLGDARAVLADADGDDAYDLGLAHDGDADRIVVLAPDGAVVHEDTVVAVLAAHYVRTADAADPVVVTTPNASGRIDERVAAAGGRTERVRLGGLHEGVASAREAGATVAFAAEPWKHLHTAFGGWIDGVCSAAVLARLVADAGGLDALTAPVTERPYRKTNVECPDALKDAAMDRVRERAAEVFPEADRDPTHGLRADFEDGSWVLIRPSGTEPYLRIYAESEAVEDLLAAATDLVEAAVADARE